MKSLSRDKTKIVELSDSNKHYLFDNAKEKAMSFLNGFGKFSVYYGRFISYR